MITWRSFYISGNLKSDMKFLNKWRSRLLVSCVGMLIFWSFTVSRTAEAAADRHSLGLQIGQVILMGDYGSRVNNGIGVGVLYDYEASDLFGLMVEASYSGHSNNNDTNSLGLLGLVPNLKVNMLYLDKLTFFGLAGFGLYRVDQTIENVSGSVLTFGFDLGAGFHLDVGENFLFGSTLLFYNIFNRVDSATVSTANPSGFSMGGTMLKLGVFGAYVF